MNDNFEQLLKQQSEAIQLLTKLASDNVKAGNTGVNTPLHGYNAVGRGIFTTQGLEREIISTVVSPIGLSAILPRFATTNTNPVYGTLTGVSDDIGEEPVNACDPAPTGYIKGCELTAQFGLIQRSTPTIDIRTVKRTLNRGDFTDLRLIGNLLGDTGLEPRNMRPDQVLNTVTMSEMLNVGVRFERKLAKMLWQGLPANGNGGGYKEFPGLDAQIATGIMDYSTGVLCPALDSDVKNFAYDSIGGGGRDIVEYVSMIEFFVRTLAETTVGATEWVFVMRPELWQELSAFWPIAYNTNRSTVLAGNNNANVWIDGRANITDRDQMRRSQSIDVNGRSYRVVLDDGIYEKNNVTNPGDLAPGEYASSIYFVPISINNGMPVTYIEYQDYRPVGDDIGQLGGTEQFWTDGGMYFWAATYNRFCYDITGSIEPRVVLRTPQLAARIDNVAYSPLQHLRSAFPESPYHANGGVSFRANPAGNANWLD